MTTTQLFMSTWRWDPTVLLGCAALLAAYAGLLRRLVPAALLFGAGVATLLLSLVSPIDTLGDTYLVSAHMVQHLLLLLIVPPLLLLGIPPQAGARLLAWAPARRLERVLSRPALAWVLAVSTIWVWHVPALYDAALADEGLHVVEHLCFLITATIFWWPVLHPVPARRLDVGAVLIYLVSAALASDLLGIIITFAPTGLYPPYLHPPNPHGVLTLLRDDWGLSPATDQQIAGVLMWIFGSLPYLAVILGTLARWLDEPEADLRVRAPGPALTEEA
ncbi:MAG TPA: cytochrome c oxidase assembly protein [Chloroflexia bacterium]|nr:cytochrome c oxidase assembly protein [Chloroflexia bacterium]